MTGRGQRVAVWLAAGCVGAGGLGCERPSAPPVPTPPARALRIVSLSPAATETLCAVGCCDRIVLRDGWSDEPAAVRRIPAVEGFAPSAESILAVRPDLVAGHFPPPGMQGALAAAGVRVVAFAPMTLAEVSASLAALADACGQPVERIARDVERDYIMEAQASVDYGIVDSIIATRALPSVTK